MTINLASIPLTAATQHSERAAILVNDFTISYQDLAHQIRACSCFLKELGVKPGDNVAILLPSVPQFTIAYFGILALGARVVPLNVLFVSDEIHYHLDDCDAKALIVWDGFQAQAIPAFQDSGCEILMVCPSPAKIEMAEAAHDFQQGLAQSDIRNFEVFPSQADDTAVILYTSGTTGRPKGAELSHFNLYDNARFVSERLKRKKPAEFELMGPGDVALAALPLFHSFGQTVIQNAFLMNGAAISLLPRFTPKDAAILIQKHKVTFFAGVPTMYIGLLHDPDVSPEQLSTLRVAISGGAALPVEILDQFKSQFDINILEGYGLSETSPVACVNNFMLKTKPGTVGPALDLCEIKIVDEKGQEMPNMEKGEITIRGSNVMKGYYKRDDATRDVLKNGWFHTGDIGYKDDDGFITIVDRKNDMIIRGGYNVYPREVEEVLYTHSTIKEAAVIGLPDKTLGEEVAAIVALKENASLSQEELESYCREHLAAYKIPRMVFFESELPKNATGKILKRTIKEKYMPG